MSSFYSSLSNEEDMLPTSYLLTQKLDSYNNCKAYEIQHSVSLSYSNLLSVNYECIGSSNYHGSEPIENSHGLSLSLGSPDPLSLDLNQYTDSSLYSLVSSDNGLKNVQYISFDLAGKTRENVKYRNFNQTTNFIPSLCQVTEVTGTFCNSKYLKAAQDLLDEVVNVHMVTGKSSRNFDEHDGSTRTDMKRVGGVSTELQESTSNAARDLLPAERHDLQNNMTKLLSTLVQVVQRYKQYFHQMQVVVSSFDTVAGPGAAKSYTKLALQTISRQFRCLRDAIKNQTQSIQKKLGEQDSNSNSQSVLSRLRYVDQKLRQQKAFQQFGIMRQPWRPQRGLPETAVSVLRAWLFEHFLHPYPKYSEKIVLARQTGLSRSQVANWFINARVRLWKPMIEDMYKDEFGNTETEPKSSPEIAALTQDFSIFDEKEDNFHGNLHGEELGGYKTGDFQESEVNFGLTHSPNKQILNMAGDSSFF